MDFGFQTGLYTRDSCVVCNQLNKTIGNTCSQVNAYRTLAYRHNLHGRYNVKFTFVKNSTGAKMLLQNIVKRDKFTNRGFQVSV